MNIKKFFTLGSIDRLAKLVNKSKSTIYRWKREGIPEKAKSLIKKLTVRKPRKKESTIVPLTAREKHEVKYQKKLAEEERQRLQLRKMEDIWEKEYTIQEYTQNKVIAIFNAIEINRARLEKAKPKDKRRVELTLKIANQMLEDYVRGARFINPEIEQPLIDEFNIDRDEAYADIYGYHYN